MRGVLAIIFALTATGCAFKFKPSIEPLVSPTVPPQPFGQPALFPEPTDPTRSIAQESPSADQDFESLSSRPVPYLRGLPSILFAAGIVGSLASLTFVLSRLKLPATDRVATGSVLAGVLGFVSLRPVDLAIAYAAAQLTSAGPVGVLLDVVGLIPIEILVLDLHIGFASLAYRASTGPCDELTPKEYFLPRWGLSP